MKFEKVLDVNSLYDHQELRKFIDSERDKDPCSNGSVIQIYVENFEEYLLEKGYCEKLLRSKVDLFYKEYDIDMLLDIDRNNKLIKDFCYALKNSDKKDTLRIHFSW